MAFLFVKNGKINSMNINLRDIFGYKHDDMINCKTRYLVCKGSRGSGKSTTVFRKLILNMLFYWEKYKVCPSALIIRQWYTTHSDSTVIEIEKAIKALHVEDEFTRVKSPWGFTHKKSGAKIIFRGMDDPTKITSINAPTPLVYCIIEEAFELRSEEDFDKLDLSIRGPLPDFLQHQITLIFNPYSDKHWLKKRFFDNADPTITALTKTYMDNDFIQSDKSFINIMETMKSINHKKFNILGLGMWGIAEGLVFDNWQVQPFDYQKMLMSKSYLNTNKYREAYGLDFGWSDPSAVVASIIDDKTKELFIYDEIYDTNLTISNLAKRIKAKGWQNKEIICDSANPREIELLKTEGIHGAKQAYKGPNSIVGGIKVLQDYKIIVHPQCKHTIEEFSLYTWDTDKTSGKFLDTPIDDHCHIMDSLRYSMFTKKATFY